MLTKTSARSCGRNAISRGSLVPVLSYKGWSPVAADGATWQTPEEVQVPGQYW